jgi:hypothetical protein
MNYKLCLLIAILINVAFSQYSSDTVGGASFTVPELGTSVTLENKKVLWKVEFKSLNELDSNSNIVQSYTSFDILSLGKPTIDPENLYEAADGSSIKTMKVTFSNTLTVGGSAVDFTFESMTFREASTVVLLGSEDSVDVQNGDYKFSFYLGAWPFLSSGNTLEFNMDIIAENNDNVTCENNGTVCSIGDGDMVNPLRICVDDGSAVDCSDTDLVLNLQVSADASGDQFINHFKWSMPNWLNSHPSTNLVFDPFFNIGAASSLQIMTTLIVSLIAAFALF